MNEIQDVNPNDFPGGGLDMRGKFSTADQYTVYRIPKKSGGFRVIEAPNDDLKLAQKASLGRLQRIFLDEDAAKQAFDQHRSDVDAALKETAKDKTEREKLLKDANRDLSDALLGNKAVLQYSHFAHAFCMGRNIATGAKAHVGAEAIITADLTDFFPSVKFAHFNPDHVVQEGEPIHKSKSYKTPMAYVFGNGKMSEKGAWMTMYRARVLPELMMHFCDFGDGKGLRLPQGAPASPFLSNVLMCRFDYRAGWKCFPFRVQDTRYADDLIFSGGSESDVRKAYAATVALLQPIGLEVNKRKYTLKKGNQRKKILGLVVNEKMNTTRFFRRRLRAAKHHCKVIYTLECLAKEQGFTLPEDLRPFFLSKTEGMTFGQKMNKVIENLQDKGIKISMDDLQSKKLKTPRYWYTKKIQGHAAFQHMVDNCDVRVDDSINFCKVQEMLDMA